MKTAISIRHRRRSGSFRHIGAGGRRLTPSPCKFNQGLRAVRFAREQREFSCWRWVWDARLHSSRLAAACRRVVRHLHLIPIGTLPEGFSHGCVQVRWRAVVGRWQSVALVYSGLRFLEAVGLWKDRNWAKWLGAISGGTLHSGGDIRSRAQGYSATRLVLFALNVAVVAYLLWNLWQKRADCAPQPIGSRNNEGRTRAQLALAPRPVHHAPPRIRLDEAEPETPGPARSDFDPRGIGAPDARQILNRDSHAAVLHHEGSPGILARGREFDLPAGGGVLDSRCLRDWRPLIEPIVGRRSRSLPPQDGQQPNGRAPPPHADRDRSPSRARLAQIDLRVRSSFITPVSACEMSIRVLSIWQHTLGVLDGVGRASESVADRSAIAQGHLGARAQGA